MADYFELDLSKSKKVGQGVAHEFHYYTTKIMVKMEDRHHSYQQLVSTIVPETDVHKDVILGTEFLQDFAITFDYPKRTIKLTEKTNKTG